MQINEKKTKAMEFNCSKKFQFSTELKFNNSKIDIETQTKLLGTIVTNKLSWDAKTNDVVKKTNARMQILHAISKFGAPINDMKEIYFSYIRSLLEQSCNVWHTSLTKENEENLERVQKSALKIILKNNYYDYANACSKLDITDLKTRRQQLFERFTLQNINHPLMKEYFIENNKNAYSLRNPEKFKVTQSKSERFRKSTVIQMQYAANNLYKQGKIP